MPETQNIKCGFIGLGDQGGPIARRMIESGLSVTLWARRPESTAPFRETAATIAPSLEVLAHGADHVGVCVLDDAAVSEVCTALIPSMRPGSRIVIHSTVDPDLCASLARKAAARDIGFLDAPVSGGGRGATEGKLTLMVGGNAGTFEATLPVLRTFGGLIVHLGDVGAGQIAKLINNSLMAANFAIGHHALEAGAAMGIDRQALVELIKASSGRSFGFETCARQASPQSFTHGAKLLAKDVKLLGRALDNDDLYAPFRDLALPVLAMSLMS